MASFDHPICSDKSIRSSASLLTGSVYVLGGSSSFSAGSVFVGRNPLAREITP
jgi:hypothetical protein